MKSWLWSLAYASIFAFTPACEAPKPSETSGAGGATGGASGAGASAGGAGVPDVACTSTGGCVRGEVGVVMACTTPDSGSGASTWEASISLESDGTEPLGSCGVSSGSGLFQLEFGLHGSPDGSVRISGLFAGGGQYTLGGPPANLQNNGLSLKGKGKLGDPMGQTQADTSFNCSEDCILDVLPHDRPVGAPGSWVTYRFVVNCDGPLGVLTNPCSTCTIAPTIFAIDAACYFVPPEL